jgi:hypothetical protein
MVCFDRHLGCPFVVLGYRLLPSCYPDAGRRGRPAGTWRVADAAPGYTRSGSARTSRIDDRGAAPQPDRWSGGSPRSKENAVLLIVAIVLLIIAIAGGVIVHPLLFVLALVAIAVYFSGR